MISVVIICYNNAAFIAAAIDSASKKDPAFDRIVIVDDCSTDQTYEIAQGYLSKDDRIQLFQNSQNMGPGPARNAGLTQVTSPYVCFLDGDDYFRDDASFQMHSALETHSDTDLFIFEGTAFETDGTQRRSAAVTLGVFSDLDAKTVPMSFVTVPWGKLYKTDFLASNSIQFPAGKYEDVPWCYHCNLCANRVVAISTPIVWYRIHDASTLQRRADHHFDAFEQWEITLSIFQNTSAMPPHIFAFIQANCFVHLTHILFAPRVPKDGEIEFARRIRGIFPSDKTLKALFKDHEI